VTNLLAAIFWESKIPLCKVVRPIDASIGQKITLWSVKWIGMRTKNQGGVAHALEKAQTSSAGN
jgi:hypothetical protein